MPEGGRLSISTENVTLQPGDIPDGLSGDHVALRITDTGCGIAADVLPRVFEPFFTTKAVDKGTGLGLSQVYGFARRSGGTVIIASELQRGTTVTVYLPRSRGRLAAPPAEQSAPHRRGRQETILVVEDNSDVRSVAVSLLAELGYQTVEAETAAAGVDMLERGHVDLVFTDVVLPGAMDGLALAQKITTVRPELPVVLTTGYARSLDGDPGYAVLRKPYDLSSLGRVIRAAIDAKGGRQPAGAAKARRSSRLLLAESELLDHFLAHDELLHLAGDGHREGVDELDVARDLVVRDLAPAEALHVLGAWRSAPGLSFIQAQSSSPYFRSGTPTTWTASILGWRKRNSSISRG